MKCWNGYCIYNKDLRCVLEEIEIDSLGMCEGCIIISLDETFLEAEKERQLPEIDGRWDFKNEQSKEV